MVFLPFYPQMDIQNTFDLPGRRLNQLYDRYPLLRWTFERIGGYPTKTLAEEIFRVAFLNGSKI